MSNSLFSQQQVIGYRIRVRGLVQGVGFRPFVRKLANALGLSGSVRNDGEGVLIEAIGDSGEIDSFVEKLLDNPPPLSRIDGLTTEQTDTVNAGTGFHIVSSKEGLVDTGVVPDAATCPKCLEEIFDPDNRRFGYPFTNCTHCGPRLSILKHIPYDRASTSMAVFAMCEDCAGEYVDPEDRRYHAQPNACAACGPQLWLEDSRGEPIDCSDPIAECADLLALGRAVAIKGMGGFQIAADAGNETAVDELRKRKHRPDKPLALMARDLDQVRDYCFVSDAEEKLLANPAAPIVLLQKKGNRLARSIAPGRDSLGLMLPNTPLHHLLLARMDRPLVMTSGNVSGDPQEISNRSARERLGRMVDAFLMHDREIVNRLDDSVVRHNKFGAVSLRRARGYAPAPIRLSSEFVSAPKVLAMGGELKSTFCLLNGQDAILSQHIGDLESAATFADYKKMVRLYLDLFQFSPEIIAVDGHRQYLSTAYGRELAKELGASLVEVQHHHAHMASCLAENGVGSKETGEVYGIILDGLGWGTDGTVWGGEILKGGLHAFKRVGHLEPVALPGGAAAIREPWRNLVAHLHAALGADYRKFLKGTPVEAHLEDRKHAAINQLIARKINTPTSTSAGRLFDAVSAALTLCVDRQTYEGQAAMAVEAAAQPFLDDECAYPVDVTLTDRHRLSLTKLWPAMLADLRKGCDPGRVAARFHKALIKGMANVVFSCGARAGDVVVLSGGVLQNKIIHEGMNVVLQAENINVLNHKEVPANDGGLALGQAVVASRN